MENAIIRIDDNNPTYCSLIAETRSEKAAFYNAVENPVAKLSEFINKKITFSNVFMTQTVITEKDDAGMPIPGTEKECIKTVLITPEGDGILSTSGGVARALFSMFQIFGTPDEWDEPMTVEVKQIDVGKNRTYKLNVCD